MEFQIDKYKKMLFKKNEMYYCKASDFAKLINIQNYDIFNKSIKKAMYLCSKKTMQYTNIHFIKLESGDYEISEYACGLYV